MTIGIAKSGKDTKVVLFVMTAKGLAVINNVISSRKEIVHAVVGAKDDAVKDDSYEEIRTAVTTHGIPHFNRREFDVDIIERQGLLGIAISWRWLIGSRNLIVLHDSLLPKYRGFNPLVSALINGETKIGVTAIV